MTTQGPVSTPTTPVPIRKFPLWSAQIHTNVHEAFYDQTLQCLLVTWNYHTSLSTWRPFILLLFFPLHSPTTPAPPHTQAAWQRSLLLRSSLCEQHYPDSSPFLPLSVSLISVSPVRGVWSLGVCPRPGCLDTSALLPNIKIPTLQTMLSHGMNCYARTL